MTLTCTLDGCARQEIRERYAAGGVTQSALAQEYGVSQARVNQLVAVQSGQSGSSGTLELVQQRLER